MKSWLIFIYFNTIFSILLLQVNTCQANISTWKTKFLKKGVEERVPIFSRENVNSPKKIARNGILVKRPGARATVLICHGFMCDKYDVSFLHLVFKNFNTLTFDFRAHGENPADQCCTFGRDECYDVLGAVEFIKNHPDLKKLPLIIYGFSMGAVAAITAGAIKRDLCDAMILDCPFDSSDKLIERSLDQIKISIFGYEIGFPGSSFLKSYAYTYYVQNLLKNLLRSFSKIDPTAINTSISPIYPEESIKYITVPVFIVGCPSDDKVPLEAVEKVYEGAPDIKRLWKCDGRRHFDPIFYKMHEYIYRTNKFISDTLNNFHNKKRHKIIETN